MGIVIIMARTELLIRKGIIARTEPIMKCLMSSSVVALSWITELFRSAMNEKKSAYHDFTLQILLYPSSCIAVLKVTHISAGISKVFATPMQYANTELSVKVSLSYQRRSTPHLKS